MLNTVQQGDEFIQVFVGLQRSDQYEVEEQRSLLFGQVSLEIPFDLSELDLCCSRLLGLEIVEGDATGIDSVPQ